MLSSCSSWALPRSSSICSFGKDRHFSILAHHVDPGIGRRGRERRVTGPRWRYRVDSRPRSVAQNRSPSQFCRLERMAGCGIIGARRKNSAVPIFIDHGAPLRNTLLAPVSADFRTSPDIYAADLLPRDRGGAINASAGMPHSRCSRQAILIVRGRFLVRMSDARWREPSSRPRSACV